MFGLMFSRTLNPGGGGAVKIRKRFRESVTAMTPCILTLELCWQTVAVLDCNDTDTVAHNDDSDDEGYPSSSEAALFISVDGMNVLVAGTDRAIHIWDYTRLVSCKT